MILFYIFLGGLIMMAIGVYITYRAARRTDERMKRLTEGESQ